MRERKRIYYVTSYSVTHHLFPYVLSLCATSYFYFYWESLFLFNRSNHRLTANGVNYLINCREKANLSILVSILNVEKLNRLGCYECRNVGLPDKL